MEEGVGLKVREVVYVDKFDGDITPGKKPVERVELVYENHALVSQRTITGKELEDTYHGTD